MAIDYSDFNLLSGASGGVIRGLELGRIRRDRRKAERQKAFQDAELAALRDDLANVQTTNEDGSLRDDTAIARDRERLFLDATASPNISEDVRKNIALNLPTITGLSARGNESTYRKGASTAKFRTGDSDAFLRSITGDGPSGATPTNLFGVTVDNTGKDLSDKLPLTEEEKRIRRAEALKKAGGTGKGSTSSVVLDNPDGTNYGAGYVKPTLDNIARGPDGVILRALDGVPILKSETEQVAEALSRYKQQQPSQSYNALRQRFSSGKGALAQANDALEDNVDNESTDPSLPYGTDVGYNNYNQGGLIQANAVQTISSPQTQARVLNLTPEKARHASNLVEFASQSQLSSEIQGFPELVLALVQTESTFNNVAVSPTGARGIGQFTTIATTELNRIYGNRFLAGSNGVAQLQNNPRLGAEAIVKSLDIVAQQLRAKNIPVTHANLIAGYKDGVGGLSNAGLDWRKLVNAGGKSGVVRTAEYYKRLIAQKGGLLV